MAPAAAASPSPTYVDPYDGIVQDPGRPRNPLVLVGAVATGGVLVAGLVAFRQVCGVERGMCGGGMAVPPGRMVAAARPSTNPATPFSSLPSPPPQGNQRMSQAMMRARVIFQGVTVATMVASAGGVWAARKWESSEGAGVGGGAGARR